MFAYSSRWRRTLGQGLLQFTLIAILTAFLWSVKSVLTCMATPHLERTYLHTYKDSSVSPEDNKLNKVQCILLL